MPFLSVKVNATDQGRSWTLFTNNCYATITFSRNQFPGGKKTSPHSGLAPPIIIQEKGWIF